MISPPFIKPGSKFHIISPAGRVNRDAVLKAAEIIENEGYVVETGEHAFTICNQFAGSDKERLHDLQAALDDPETDVILCSRGGYGTVRLIDKVDFTSFKKHPKWLVGYSDITVLHSAIHNFGYATIHATMAKFFAETGDNASLNLKSLFDVLKGKKPDYYLDFHSNNQIGCTSGQLVGGNLSIVCSLIGTKNDLETRGKILFIEDVDEYLYHIDRMMHQLKQAGKLNCLKGLVVGDFSDVKDNDDPFGKTVQQIISEAVKEYDYPVAFGFPAGHEEKNLALVFGNEWQLDVKKSGSTLKLMESENNQV